jgi:hypothetical protein
MVAVLGGFHRAISWFWRRIEQGKRVDEIGDPGYLRPGLDGHQMREINGFGD